MTTYTTYKEKAYQCLGLNTSPKCADGFIEDHLQELYQSLIQYNDWFDNVVVGHMVIESPNKSRLDRFLDSYIKQRIKANSSIQAVKLLSVQETRHRDSNPHQHIVAIIATNDAYIDLKSLALLGVNLSQVKDKNNSRLLKRSNNKNYHILNQEFEDSFNRLSYVCKIHSKTSNTMQTAEVIRKA